MITEFNQEFPSETISTLTNMILTRSVDRVEFGLALLNVQSYVMGQLLTSGPLFGASNRLSPPTHEPSDEEALAALQSLSPPQEGLVGAGFDMRTALIILRWAMLKFMKEYM